MKNVIRKAASLVLMLALGISCTMPVSAAESLELRNEPGLVIVENDLVGITPFYTSIDFISYNFSIGSGGAACVDAYLERQSNGNSCKITAKLQRKTSSSWANVKTFTASGSSYAIMCDEYYVSSGYDYRVLYTFSVYSGSTLLEQTSATSKTVSY